MEWEKTRPSTVQPGIEHRAEGKDYHQPRYRYDNGSSTDGRDKESAQVTPAFQLLYLVREAPVEIEDASDDHQGQEQGGKVPEVAPEPAGLW